MATSLFITVYAVGVAAAIRLLPRGRTRAVAVAALAFVALVLVLSGGYLLYPALVAGGALIGSCANFVIVMASRARYR
jgi:amino acid efflux transporter